MNLSLSPADAADLVRTSEVHRDLYLSPSVFDLEMREVWGRAWLFVGHDSHIPRPGDFVTVDLASRPAIMIRREDGGISVLSNRCAHKGAPVCHASAGNVGRFLRCGYHGWSYRLDGSLLGQPLKHGYVDSGFEQCEGQRGLSPWGEVAVHRGFVFARAIAGGPSFQTMMGELLAALDLLCDRSPTGRLSIAGGVVRTRFAANWKLYLENINDAVHPVTTHASATQSAQAVWTSHGTDAAPPLAMRQLLPFASGYQFFEQMGARLLPYGHSLLGTRQSLHTSYTDLGEYGHALQQAHGAARAQAVLEFAPQNVVFYPNMALKGTPQVMRVLRPVSAAETVLEAWAFQPEGAPAELLQSALMYNRQVFSPMSIVAHDDLHLFERMQHSLAAQGNPWVSLHRGAGADNGHRPRDVDGVDEGLHRNQFQAWRHFMKQAAQP
jgi:nitrite reductase/ring-hydroxylating ferredoxin subunit